MTCEQQSFIQWLYDEDIYKKTGKVERVNAS